VHSNFSSSRFYIECIFRKLSLWLLWFLFLSTTLHFFYATRLFLWCIFVAKAYWKNLSLVSGLAVKQVLSTPDLILGVGGREGSLFEVGGSPSGENIRFDISHYNWWNQRPEAAANCTPRTDAIVEDVAAAIWSQKPKSETQRPFPIPTPKQWTT